MRPPKPTNDQTRRACRRSSSPVAPHSGSPSQASASPQTQTDSTNSTTTPAASIDTESDEAGKTRATDTENDETVDRRIEEHHGGPMSGGPEETELTGDTADKVEPAALEAVPGGTVIRVETDSDGSRYEAHVTTDDGTEVVVKVDEDFEVTDTEERVAGCDGHHSGGPRPGSDDSYETTN